MIPEPTGGSGLSQGLMVVPMIAGGGAMSLMFMGSGGSPLTYIASGLYGLSTVGMLAASMGRGSADRNRRLAAQRRDYLRHLAQVRGRVGKAAARQYAALHHAHPDPQALWGIALSSRLWERRPGDADFAAVRVALGPQNLLARLVPPETRSAEDLDPVAASALRQFLHAHATVAELPVAIALRSFRRVNLLGDAEDVRALVRAVIGQVATLHAPDDLRIAVCAGGRIAPVWEWVKWLPHAQHPSRADRSGPSRLISPDVTALERLLGPELDTRPRYQRDGTRPSSQPHLVVIVDESVPPAKTQLDRLQGVTVLDLAGVMDRTEDPGDESVLTMHLHDRRLEVRGVDDSGAQTALSVGQADRLSIAEAEALARVLAPVRLATEDEAQTTRDAEAITFAGLHGLGDVAVLDPATAWAIRPSRDHLRVPIGLSPTGTRVELDLKESAQEGMGPHGMIIGATGSGKSELLRTLVMGLAVAHSSETLNLVLVDFKGGATFLGLEGLPHVSAVITNLSDELPLVDRMYDALHGELVRRQDLLRREGNYASVRDYEKARAAGAPLAALPSLLIVVDEFSELLANKPEFAELFVMIGRLGRSLGVHLLLASQHLDEGRLRGLGTHLSYRIALRTFSAVESRIVIGVADAYELPASPGHGFLLYDNTQLVRFKAAYVSGPYQSARLGPAGQVITREIVPYTAAPVGLVNDQDSPGAEAEPADDTVPDAPSVLEILVSRLRGAGPPAHQVWLPPLDEPPALGDLLDSDDPRLGNLWVPVGVVDKPFEQRRDPLWTDLSGSSGHVAVVGGPRSGKSTLVATLLSGLSLTHSPAQVQAYCLDFGGGVLSGLAGLPHVGCVAGRRDADLMRRTVAELSALLDRREAAFTADEVASIAHYRRGLSEGRIAGDGYGDVFLVIDGWPTFLQEYPQLEATVTRLIGRGLGYGVHVVVTANRWAEIRPAVRELLGTRLELRLGEAFESEINRRAAANVPERSPGRGISREGLHMLAALPRVDGRSSTNDLVAAMRGVAMAARLRWAGAPLAPRVRLLPTELPFAELPGPDGRRLPIGIDEESLSTVYLDFDAEPHLLILGDTESGKSNLLRVIARRIVEAYRPEEARVVVVDYRRTLLDAVPDSHKVGYAASAEAAGPLVAEIIAALRVRLPGPDLTTEQLRDRSWWRGSDLFVLVDDYDLMESASGSPLAPLADLVPVGRDIGLHLVVARATGGSSRVAFEPILRRLRETGAPGLQLSGNPEEGPVLGKVRPQHLPPGRGVLVARRRANITVQTALLKPGDAA